MVRRLPLLTLILAAANALGPRVSFAHGGEQHGPAVGKASLTATPGSRLAFAQTENFEFLIKHPEQAAGEPMALRVFLADYTTNEPIENATIELEFSGPADVEVQAQATASPGVYQVIATFPKDGTYEVLASVAAGEIVDLMIINGIEIGPPKVETHGHAHASSRAPWIWAAVVVLLVVASTVGWVIRQRKRWMRMGGAV